MANRPYTPLLRAPQAQPAQKGAGVLRLSFGSSLHPPYGPDSCVRASDASNEGFWSIVLLEKACRSEGGSWRVSEVVVVPGGVTAWGCFGVSREKPKNQEFCLI